MRTTERMDVLQRFLKNETTEHLDKQINAVLRRMDEIGVDSPEYPTLMGYVERLNKVKELQARKPISTDTIAQIVGSLAGVFVVVIFEQKGIIRNTKAFNMIPRIKT